jgi:hypothetical protein
MKNALFPIVLVAAVAGSAAMAPVFADDISKDRVPASGKIRNADHKDKTPRLRKNTENDPPVRGNTIQNDYYMRSGEEMMKGAM